LVSADKGYIPLNLSDNIISDIVDPNIPDTIANIKQNHHETEGFIFAIQDRVINNRTKKKHIMRFAIDH
jgi:hypothetical protein